MELNIKPYHKNGYPKRGVLIKGASPAVWLTQIGQLGLELNHITAYPIPATIANQLFGCLVVIDEHTVINQLNNNSYLQLVNNKIFIPEYSVLSPLLSDTEWQKLFSAHYHFYHPEIGLAELAEPINWQDLTLPLKQIVPEITVPLKGVSIPQKISTFYIQADPVELAKGVEQPFANEEDALAALPFDMQKLLKGNQKEMDKFLAFLEKNPELALKYAIPLDTLGTMRGGNKGKFVFGKNGNNGTPQVSLPVIILGAIVVSAFLGYLQLNKEANNAPVVMPVFLMLFIGRLIYKFLNKDSNTNTGKVSGSALLDTNRFTTLQQKYEKLALEYISQGQHQKAAHIYLKLLKNNVKAAQVLENGKCYAEAAAVYLNYCQNKLKAAECYEKAKVYNEALVLYKELKNNEKAGDMYNLLNRRMEANMSYKMVADDYKKNNQYVKASLICRNKIGNAALAQELLLSGWINNIDAFNCLNNYYNNIPDVKVLEQEINRIYKTTNTNKEVFLQVIKHEYTKHEVLRENIKDIAYEIIAEKLDKDPFIASELIFFNKEDKSITKDVMKFKASKKIGRL